MSEWNVSEVITRLPANWIEEIECPAYFGCSGKRRVALALESMSRHMTDEGWQIMLALRHAGYALYGRNIPEGNETHVPTILDQSRPDVLLLQDKREWDKRPGKIEHLNADEPFTSYQCLKDRTDIFKLTILKDSHGNPTYHRQSAEEIGCHAWVVYYHPRIVKRLAPYVRERHLIRTYHSLDSDIIPDLNQPRSGCLLSGAVSGVYPLRQRLFVNAKRLPQTEVLKHPGYGVIGNHTPQFLRRLSQYKVAICTASIYGYALRKIIEATACGCRVLTDLPVDEVLPEIDGNLVRVRPDIAIDEVADLLNELCATYDTETQMAFATKAQAYYDYRASGCRLAHDIERLRNNYA